LHLDLTNGEIKSHIIKLAIPALVGYFFHTMINMTDTFFAGMISTHSLAALSLSASIFFMILAVGIGMSEAVTSLVGNALGEKDTKKAQHIALNAIVLAALISIVLSIVGLIGVPLLIEALGDTSYMQQTLLYINPVLYGVVFFIFSFFFNALLVSIGDMKSFRNILIFVSFVNIILDYIFIEYLHLGISGISYATVITEFIAMAYLFYKLKHTKLWVGMSEFVYDKDIFIKLLQQGLPPSVNMFMMAFGMYIITYFVAPYGKEAVAGFGIGMRIEQIFLMPVVGLNIAVLSIISQNNGAKMYGRIKETLKRAIRYGWIISIVAVLSFFLFAGEMASLLSSDLVVIGEAKTYLYISGLASFGFVVIFVYIAMLQGMGQPNVIMPVSFYRQVLAPVLLLSLLASFKMDIIYVWIIIDLIIFSSAIFLWWYAKKKFDIIAS